MATSSAYRQSFLTGDACRCPTAWAGVDDFVRMHGQSGQARQIRHYLASPTPAVALTCAYNLFSTTAPTPSSAAGRRPASLNILRMCRTVMVPLTCIRFGIYASPLELAKSFYFRRKLPYSSPSTETLPLVNACSCAQLRFSGSVPVTSLDCSWPAQGHSSPSGPRTARSFDIAGSSLTQPYAHFHA